MTKYLEGRGKHPPQAPSGRTEMNPPAKVTHTAVRAGEQTYSDGQRIDGVRDSSKDRYPSQRDVQKSLRSTPYPGSKAGRK